MIKREWQIHLIQFLAVPGLLVAFYLWLFHNGSLSAAACSASGWDDCGAVSGPDAPYASVGPVPVATIGFVGYALIFFLIWVRAFIPLVEDYLPELMVGVTGLAFLFTIYLTALEVIVIHAVCRYCLMSAAIVTIMLALSISYLRSATAVAREEEHVAEFELA